MKKFLQANGVSPGPAVYHPLTIRLHTEFVWLSSQTHPDRLSTPTPTAGFSETIGNPGSLCVTGDII